MIALFLPDVGQWWPVAAPFVLVLASVCGGWRMGLRFARWNIDREMSASFMRQLPQIQNLERAARAPVVDRVAKRYQRQQHRAAYSDVVLQGREVTLVAADRRHLHKAAFAIQKNAVQVELDMVHAPEPPEEPEKKFTPPDLKDPPAPTLRVMEGGKS